MVPLVLDRVAEVSNEVPGILEGLNKFQSLSGGSEGEQDHYPMVLL